MGSRVDDVVKTVKRFIEARHDGTSPLLLGYSGGPDSKALLYALIEQGALPLHLAHVDHGWRSESRREAEQIREEAALLNLPLHTCRLTPSAGGNLEEKGRRGRLTFFCSLFQEIPFQALLLGHQASDAAEVALQRVLEGAHLPFLGGMEEESCLEGMRVWRPLLGMRKERLFQFLGRKGKTPLLDPSNEDPQFLRARLRSQLFPLLSHCFGKEVEKNLSLLGERAFEWRDYLERKVAPAWDQRETASWGMALDLRPLERLEARFLIQKSFPKGLTRTILEQLLDQVEQRGAWRRFFVAGRTMVVHRGWFFLFNNRLKILELKEIKSLLRQFNPFLL